jgi:regulator of sirC expression with transglutaminase-like and TPR domain
MANEVSNNELHALLSLIDDPDENIFNRVADGIFALGVGALPHLKHELENCFNPLIEERLKSVMERIQNENLYLELTNWIHFGSHDLLKGAMLLAKFQYPELDEMRVTQTIGQITQDIWIELSDTMLTTDKIRVINHILFDDQNLTPNPKNAYALQDLFIQQVLDTKRGNALSLGVIYLILGQALKIPLYGVDLPHHFILACARIEPATGKHLLSEEHVSFYINPFYKGMVFSAKEIDRYLGEARLPIKKEFYTPCTNVRVIMRLAEDMAKAYKRAGNNPQAETLKKLIALLGV